MLAKRVNEISEAIRKILLRNVESLANMFNGMKLRPLFAVFNADPFFEGQAGELGGL